MHVKTLRSWKIASAVPFYPINLQCIHDNDTVAVTTYAPHVFNTFIVRNFREAIEFDKPAYKSFLHDNLFPGRIIDVANGIAENAILLDNGQVKYFKSARQLDTVAYLQGVRTICRRGNEFALVRMSEDGTEFFIEFHPDEFHADEIRNRRVFNISFDKIPELQSTWHQTHFKLKELQMSCDGNSFLKLLLPDDIMTDVAESSDTCLFLAMDYSFCSVHITAAEPIVNPIVQCTSKIVDFWAGSNVAHILLLLENGAMEILYVKEQLKEITRQNIYFGSELSAFRYANGIFYYSNGFVVQFGQIGYSEEYHKFIFTRKTVNLPGIVGIDVLPQFNVVLYISENCQFYAMQMETEVEAEWLAIDESIQRQLTNVKCQVLELTDTYDELLKQYDRQQHIIDVIHLKRTDLESIDNVADDDQKYRFVATCTVTRSPNFTHPNDSLAHTINIPNHIAYDHNKSFFVHILLTTVTYANEFDANIWHLKFGWSNDHNENEYANCHLTKRMLLAPIRLNIHLQQQHLPVFRINIATFVKSMGSSIEINFPVRMEQPDYSDLMEATKCSSILEKISDIHLSEISSTIFVPTEISVDNLLGDRLKITSKDKIKTTTATKNNAIYSIRLLDKMLSAVHYGERETLQLSTNDPDLMYLFKRFIYRRINMQLNMLQRECDVQISSNALKEYLVCFKRTSFFPFNHRIFQFQLIFLCFFFWDKFMLYIDRQQSTSSHLNVISSATDRADKYREMLQCIGKVRRMSLLSSAQQ